MNIELLEMYNEINEIINERIRVIKLLGCEHYFPKDKRLEEYSPYFTSEDELNKWAFFETNEKPNKQLEIVVQTYKNIEVKLILLKVSGQIYSYEYKNKEYIVQAPKYVIYLKVLHVGDLVLYTVNKKSRKRGNRFRGLRVDTTINNMLNYL